MLFRSTTSLPLSSIIIMLWSGLINLLSLSFASLVIMKNAAKAAAINADMHNNITSENFKNLVIKLSIDKIKILLQNN